MNKKNPTMKANNHVFGGQVSSTIIPPSTEKDDDLDKLC